MTIIRGIDGCKAGWLCLSLLPGESHPTARVFDIDARTLFEERAKITAIDIPIGLPTAGTRQVDQTARKLLGPMKSSVFPTPVRATLSAPSYEMACMISARTSGKKISKQTFCILPRIDYVDKILRMSPELINSVYEVHPEVCFAYWNSGRPLQHPKKSGFGFMERLTIVEQVFGKSPYDVRATVPRKQATDDDILDAFAALWTAQRIHDGTAIAVSNIVEKDEFNLPMQMWA